MTTLPPRGIGRSPKRAQILALIVKGLTNHQIAERVGVKAPAVQRWRKKNATERKPDDTENDYRKVETPRVGA